MDRHRVAIVIPALNEGMTIAAVVHAAQVYGTCVVVDDGSTDATAVVAREAGALVVSHLANRGYDAALESGFHKAEEAGFEAVVTLDADGQHNPELLREFLAHLDAGAAVVLGVRNKRQRLAEHVFAWYAKWRFGIADPLCGLKAYRMDVYRALGHFDAYKSIGTELALFAARNGYPIASVHFGVGERVGNPRFGRKLSANWKIFRALALSL